MNPSNPHVASVPEFRFPKNASLPITDDVIGDLSALLPATILPNEATDIYNWGRVERTGTSIRVIPQRPGEFEFVVSANDENGIRCSVLCRLGVNGDPRSLRKIIPPPVDAPFQKECSVSVGKDIHRRAGLFGHRTMRIVGASIRGVGHAHKGLFRDDHMDWFVCEKRKCIFLAVADGCGSAPFARKGSEIAVNAALSFLKDKATGKGWRNIFQSGNVLAHAAYRGSEEIVKFSKECPESPDKSGRHANIDDFHTTLLLAAVRWTRDGGLTIRTFSIGDGAIVWKSTFRSESLNRPDFGRSAGETLYITMPEVWLSLQANIEEFLGKHSQFLEVPSDEATSGSLMLMTDGISDLCFWGSKSVQSNENWSEFWSTLSFKTEEHNPSKSPDEEKERLLKSIAFYRKGASDDRTLLMLRAIGPASEEVFHA